MSQQPSPHHNFKQPIDKDTGLSLDELRRLLTLDEWRPRIGAIMAALEYERSLIDGLIGLEELVADRLLEQWEEACRKPTNDARVSHLDTAHDDQLQVIQELQGAQAQLEQLIQDTDELVSEPLSHDTKQKGN